MSVGTISERSELTDPKLRFLVFELDAQQYALSVTTATPVASPHSPSCASMAALLRRAQKASWKAPSEKTPQSPAMRYISSAMPNPERIPVGAETIKECSCIFGGFLSRGQVGPRMRELYDWRVGVYCHRAEPGQAKQVGRARPARPSGCPVHFGGKMSGFSTGGRRRCRARSVGLCYLSPVRTDDARRRLLPPSTV